MDLYWQRCFEPLIAVIESARVSVSAVDAEDLIGIARRDHLEPRAIGDTGKGCYERGATQGLHLSLWQEPNARVRPPEHLSLRRGENQSSMALLVSQATISADDDQR